MCLECVDKENENGSCKMEITHHEQNLKHLLLTLCDLYASGVSSQRDVDYRKRLLIHDVYLTYI